MALSRTEQDLQKHYSSLGMSYINVVKYLVDLCKGRVLERERARWFYNLFLDRVSSNFNAPQTTEEVQKMLQNAWWIEEDDLIQEITLIIFRFQFGPERELAHLIGRNLRDYIIFYQKLFSRSLGADKEWQENYEYHCEKQYNDYLDFHSYGPEMIFKTDLIHNSDLTIFERYLLYLNNGEEEGTKYIAERTSQYIRQIDKYIAKLKLSLMEKNICLENLTPLKRISSNKTSSNEELDQ